MRCQENPQASLQPKDEFILIPYICQYRAWVLFYSEETKELHPFNNCKSIQFRQLNCGMFRSAEVS